MFVSQRSLIKEFSVFKMRFLKTKKNFVLGRLIYVIIIAYKT